LAKAKKSALKTTAGKKDKSYKHPIPKRGRILAFLRDTGRPQKPGELFQEFGLKAPEKRALLIDKHRNMLTAGQILENRGGEFCPADKLNPVTGRVSGHRDGFGFVDRDEDVFLSARNMSRKRPQGWMTVS
jgi:ribonuclease R